MHCELCMLHASNVHKQQSETGELSTTSMFQSTIYMCIMQVQAQLTQQSGVPNNPYRRSDTAWAPYISTGALFPPTSQPSQHHPSLLTPNSQVQQLYSRESASPTLLTGGSVNKQLHSKRSTSKQTRGETGADSIKRKSSRALLSGDVGLHPELSPEVLSKHSTQQAALYSGHSTQSGALQSGYDHAQNILDSHQRVTAMLRTGDSTVHPVLKTVAVQEPSASYKAPSPGEREHRPGNGQPNTGSGQNAVANGQQAIPVGLHTGDRNVQPAATSEQYTHYPRQDLKESLSSAVHPPDGQAMLSSATPDRLEEPRVAHQSLPSSDSEDGAEQRSARGPAPTGPPSTVSRSGRVVQRAAKVRQPCDH